MNAFRIRSTRTRIFLHSRDWNRWRVLWHVEFQVRDLWCGLFWRHVDDPHWAGFIVYICLVPMVPLVIEVIWDRSKPWYS